MQLFRGGRTRPYLEGAVEPCQLPSPHPPHRLLPDTQRKLPAADQLKRSDAGRATVVHDDGVFLIEGEVWAELERAKVKFSLQRGTHTHVESEHH